MRVVIVGAVLFAAALSCKPDSRVNHVFKANEETSADELADECRPDPNITGDQIEVCRQSTTGLVNGDGNASVDGSGSG